MCRTGGRRCTGSTTGSRATQNTRKAVSRARKALREAKTTGDADAITTARHRLDAARTAHQEARNAMRHNDNPAHGGDVTPPTGPDPDKPVPSTPGSHSGDRNGPFVVNNHATGVTGSVYQAGVITGGVVFTAGPHGDVTGGTPTDSGGRPDDRQGDRGHDADDDQGGTRSDSRSMHNHNVASGNQHVEQQIGFVFGSGRPPRARGFGAGDNGDVTSRPPSSTGGGDHRRGRTFNVHNDNIAHPGAHVGSQHDVTAGDGGDVTFTFRGAANVNTGSGTQINEPGRDQGQRPGPRPWGEYHTTDEQARDNRFRFHGTTNLNTGREDQDNRDHGQRWHDDFDAHHRAATAHLEAAQRAAQRAEDDAAAITRQARELMRQHNIPAAPGGGLQIDTMNGRIFRINGHRV